MENELLYFRAYAEASYTDENDEEKEVVVAFDGVGLDEYGTPYVYEDHFNHSIENLDVSDSDLEKIEEYFYTNGNFGEYDEYYLLENADVVQYIGKKDSDGKPIFESDYVKVDDKVIYYVVYSTNEASYKLFDIKNGVEANCIILDSYKCKVVGNYYQDGDYDELLKKIK